MFAKQNKEYSNPLKRKNYESKENSKASSKCTRYTGIT